MVGGTELLAGLDEEAWAVCAVGSACTRRKVVERMQQCGRVRFATLVDPSVLLSPSATIGEGSIVCAGTILGAGSVVVRDLPEWCTAVGVPARPVKYRDKPETIF